MRRGKQSRRLNRRMHLPVFDKDGPTRHPPCILGIMGHHQNGAIPQKPGDQLQHFSPERRPKCGKRLVHQNHIPIRQQDPRQHRPALLPARQSPRQPRLHPLQTHLPQSPPRPVQHLSRRARPGRQPQRHVRQDIQMREKVVVLKQHRHGPLPRRQGRHVAPLPRNAPRIRQFKPTD